jgi:hypothetical protein
MACELPPLREIVKAAYFEHKVTRQLSTGCGGLFLAQPDYPGRKWKEEELGLGAEGPCKCGAPTQCRIDGTMRQIEAERCRAVARKPSTSRVLKLRGRAMRKALDRDGRARMLARAAA